MLNENNKGDSENNCNDNNNEYLRDFVQLLSIRLQEMMDNFNRGNNGSDSPNRNPPGGSRNSRAPRKAKAGVTKKNRSKIPRPFHKRDGARRTLSFNEIPERQARQAPILIPPPAPRRPVRGPSRIPRPPLPLPFDYRPVARRALFQEPEVLLPIPPCPVRKSTREARRRLVGKHDNLPRKCLVFDNLENDDGNQQVNQQVNPEVQAGAAYDGTLALPYSNAPVCDERSESHSNGVEAEDCPAAPNNSPSNPEEDGDVSMADDNRWARISTPASAPLPNIRYTPITSRRTRRRRSDGSPGCATKKRLMFD